MCNGFRENWAGRYFITQNCPNFDWGAILEEWSDRPQTRLFRHLLACTINKPILPWIHFIWLTLLLFFFQLKPSSLSCAFAAALVACCQISTAAASSSLDEPSETVKNSPHSEPIHPDLLLYDETQLVPAELLPLEHRQVDPGECQVVCFTTCIELDENPVFARDFKTFSL